jgi:threonine dehydrogenase-like Zn-dependent dehydrogenase
VFWPADDRRSNYISSDQGGLTHDDEQVLFLSDIFPTGYMAAESCDIEPGDTIAVWGCGPVGQLAMKSAFLLGAERVIGIDRLEERLRMAHEKVGAETLNYEEVDIYDALMERTGGRGGGFIDKVPFGSVMNRGLTIKTGQTHVQRYLRPLLERIEKGEIDPSFVITHRLPLTEAAHGYDIFNRKEDQCIKIVLKP